MKIMRSITAFDESELIFQAYIKEKYGRVDSGVFDKLKTKTAKEIFEAISSGIEPEDKVVLSMYLDIIKKSTYLGGEIW